MGLRAPRSAFRPVHHVPAKMHVWKPYQSPDSVLDSDHIRDQESHDALPTGSTPTQLSGAAPPAPLHSPQSPTLATDVDPVLLASISSANSAVSHQPDSLALEDVFWSPDSNIELTDDDLGLATTHSGPAAAATPSAAGTGPTGLLAPRAQARAALPVPGQPANQRRWAPSAAPLAAPVMTGPPSLSHLNHQAHPTFLAVGPTSETGSLSEDELLFSEPSWLDRSPANPLSPTTSNPTPAVPLPIPETRSPPPPVVPMRRAPAAPTRPIAIAGARAAARPQPMFTVPASGGSDSYSPGGVYFNISTPAPPTAAPSKPPQNPATPASATPTPTTPTRPTPSAPAAPTATSQAPLPTATTSAPIPIPRPQPRIDPDRLPYFRIAGPDWDPYPASPSSCIHMGPTSRSVATACPPPAAPPRPPNLADYARCRAAFNACTLASFANTPSPHHATPGRPATHPAATSRTTLAPAFATAAAATQAAAAVKRAIACAPTSTSSLAPAAAASTSAAAASSTSSFAPASAAGPASTSAAAASTAAASTSAATAAATSSAAGSAAAASTASAWVHTRSLHTPPTPAAAPAAQGSSPASPPAVAAAQPIPVPACCTASTRRVWVTTTPEDDFELLFCEPGDWDLA